MARYAASGEVVIRLLIDPGRKEIYSVDTRSLPLVTLRQKLKSIILPFPPYVGLSVSDHILYGENKEDEEYTEFYSDKIEKVEWNNFGNTFVCSVTPYQMIPQDILGRVIDHYERYGGWIIDG